MTVIPEVSIVIPVYNERESLRPLWEELSLVLAPSWEVVFVDDGSMDGSAEELRALRDPRIRILQFPSNYGKSAALSSGFRRSRGALVVTLDADLQSDPRDIFKLLEALQGADVAAGRRVDRRDPLAKQIVSRMANRFRNWITHDSIRDSACPLKAFRREVLAHLPPFSGMHRFYPTLASLAGFRVTEVDVRHRPRRFGRSKYGIWDRFLGPLADCLVVRWMQRRYFGPIEVKELSHGRRS